MQFYTQTTSPHHPNLMFQRGNSNLEPPITQLSHSSTLQNPPQLSRLNIRTPMDFESPTGVDEGYCSSSISSWPTLMQLNREFEDRAFKSTPLRLSENRKKVADNLYMSHDSGLGYSPMTNSTASLVKPLPFGVYTPFGMNHMRTSATGSAQPRLLQLAPSQSSAFSAYTPTVESIPYGQVLAHVRSEMMGLIENSMCQLEMYFKQQASMSTFHDRMINVDCAPLNLKANHTHAAHPTTSLQEIDKREPIESITVLGHVDKSSFIRRSSIQHKTDEDFQALRKVSTPLKRHTIQQLALKSKIASTNRRRRLRIRTGSRQLRVRQSFDEVDPRINQVQETSSIKSDCMEQTLDLRLKPNTLEIVEKGSDCLNKKIEKFVRQICVRSSHSERDAMVTRDHELFHALQVHFNKEGDILTPEGFLRATQVAVREFYQSVKDRKDNDPTWKKEIYKTVSALDCSIPEFISYVN